MTEKETELRTRVGHGTSSIVDREQQILGSMQQALVDGEQEILGSMQQALDDVDCGWDEDYDNLPAVNLFPENNNSSSRREEAELDPMDPMEYFREDGEFQDEESLDDNDFEADFMSEEEEEEAQMDEEHRVVMELTVSQWPPAVIQENELLCLYCHEKIENPSEATKLPYCPHIFHRHCMVSWPTGRTDGTQHFECPVCRQSMYTPPG